MKFHCTVEIHDRTLSVCSQRRSQSILAFTKKSDRNNEVYLYLQTRQKKQGTRYQIANNVEQVFTKFIADGKVTIRLTRPCHDLIIQSTSIHVKSFIHVLNLIRNAQFQHHDMVVKDIVKSVTLTPNVFFNSSEFCLVKTKVVVNKKSEYPTLQGFPRTTEQLILRGLDRKSFDRQILRLQSLNVLDLSDNKISYLPREVGTLPHLQQLVLSRNTLGKSPGSKWAWLEQTAIKHTLQFLDISDNSLTELPIQIRNLNALAHLKVSQNELAYLPHNIGALRNLKVLDVARNRLSYLPATITHLRLQFLDVTENPFTHDTKTYVHGTESTTSIRMPSLVDVSAKSILKSRITYDASTIPYTLVEYLDEAKCCYLCRTACFACYIRKLIRLPLLLVEIKTSVNWDKELDEEAERQRRRKKESTEATSTVLPPVKKPEVVPQLPKPRSSVSPKLGRTKESSAILDLLGLDAPATNQTNVNGSGDDVFSSFLSAPPASVASTGNDASNGSKTTTIASKSEEESFFNQPTPLPQEKSKMTKDSILALYGTPSHQPAIYGVSGGVYPQHSLPYKQQMPNVGAFGQQSPLNQLGQLPTQMPVTNQIPVNQNQIIANPNSIGVIGANPLGLHIGQMNQLNGVPNAAITMPPQMMMQLGQSNVASNNGWSGMLTQNIQPAPGSNPFFNLTAQQQQSTAFAAQLPQQMSQMSLGDMNFASTTGKPATAAIPGQTLSTNLWQ